MTVIDLPYLTEECEAVNKSTFNLPPNAQIVLTALQDSPRPMKAYTILETLRDEGINAPMTVYRALDRLVAEGLVRKIDSLNAYIALPQPVTEPVVLIVCRECQSVKIQPIDDTGAKWLQSLGVDGCAVSIEAQGDCHSTFM